MKILMFLGTIKRKPSMKPNLPLTSMTRQLKEVGENRDSDPDSTSPVNCSSPATYTNTGTLTRRHSRRKSNSTDDGSNSGTLKRNYKTRENGRGSGASTPLGTPVRERASPLVERRISSPISPQVISTGMPSCMVS